MVLSKEDKQRIQDGEIEYAILNDGSKVRVFIESNMNRLCKFKHRSRKFGLYLDESLVKSLVEKKPKKSYDEITYKMISKFRKEALKSTFKNNFIDCCLKLPSTYEEWVKEGKLSPYEYSITTGCSITGKLVSVETICKKISNGDRLRDAIKNRFSFYTGIFNFDGYDGSVSLEIKENGEFYGYLNKEYKDCGNGYYYLLINDEYFIGYDID